MSTEDLVIDGQMQGSIGIGDHSLTIGSDAKVVADLAAKNVTISGTVKGNVMGNAKVELKSTAKVEGDVSAPKFRDGRRSDADREGGYGDEEEIEVLRP